MLNTFEKIVEQSKNNILQNLYYDYLSKIESNKIDWEKSSLTFNEGEYQLSLISKNNEYVKLTFLIFKNVINIYIGDSFIHKVDDVQIKNEKDYILLKKEIEVLLYSKITEKLLFKNLRINKFEYLFHHLNKIVRYRSFCFFQISKFTIENQYDSWI